MKTTLFVAIAVACALTSQSAQCQTKPSISLMPRVEDYTLMWWAEGFPSHTASAPWLNCIRTGYYAMVLDTEKLQIPHFGTLPQGTNYTAAGREGNAVWQRLPPANLTMSIDANGKTYRCAAGGKWTNFTGPRLIESGRFVQRSDVTDLVFTSDNGERLNVEARFETAAWPDRLALVLAARPGLQPIKAGEACFGRVGGGFGLDGTNCLEIPHRPELDPEKFTLELWVYVPTNFQPSNRTFPWLVCKNMHEEMEGNYGIVILNGRPQARLNIGGGRDNEFTAEARPDRPLKIEEWNHLAMSYDGDVLRLYLNGELAGEKKIGRKRMPGHDGLSFGRRQDNSGDGYHFRGVIDEIRIYDRALTPAEIQSRYANPDRPNEDLKPICEWCFQANGHSAATRPMEELKSAAMEIGLTAPKGSLGQRWTLSPEEAWNKREWREVYLAFNPINFKVADEVNPVIVHAVEKPGGKAMPVEYEPSRGWIRVNLDGVKPIIPSGGFERRNDAMERVRLTIANPTEQNQVARLLFEKTESGFHQNIGSPITGISAILRDGEGNPTGIPVQLSKDWHTRPEGGVYSGLWFHGFSQIRLLPRTTVELELVIVYGHWGGVAASSHSQLCLIGWGSDQLWNQSALGSWGESICYEPDQAQAECGVLDVRPLMVRSMNNDEPWSWTRNVGGGDFFRLFDKGGKRVFPARMRTVYARQGPCLAEVTFAGHTGPSIEHAATVSISRTDDLVRGTYRLRLDVKRAVDFSRFVIFQVGADTYSYTGDRKMAWGNEAGLMREWATHWGGNTTKTSPIACKGRMVWISMHEAEPRPPVNERGAWANRGIVVRSWSAMLGGKPAAPWIAEHGVNSHGTDTSTIDFVPPPGVTRLVPGDYVEATFEHIVMPQHAEDYYGPNESLRKALKKWGNTWKMILREASGNDRKVATRVGSLVGLYPDVRVRAKRDHADIAITGGIGYVPITVAGLSSPNGYALTLDGKRVDQSVHGNDFWQTDYDAVSRTWSRTYNLPLKEGASHRIRLMQSR